MEKAVTMFLSGVTLMFVDGFENAILIDCRNYPARNVQEPWKDRVLRGSRDGFVETLVHNFMYLIDDLIFFVSYSQWVRKFERLIG